MIGFSIELIRIDSLIKHKEYIFISMMKRAGLLSELIRLFSTEQTVWLGLLTLLKCLKRGTMVPNNKKLGGSH